jgi:hypothetical protein
MMFSVGVGLLIVGPLDSLDGALDRVMDELVKLGTVDPSVSAELDKALVEVSLAIDAETPEDAVAAGAGTVRAALHAAELHTRNWPVFRHRSVEAELVDA